MYLALFKKGQYLINRGRKTQHVHSPIFPKGEKMWKCILGFLPCNKPLKHQERKGENVNTENWELKVSTTSAFSVLVSFSFVSVTKFHVTLSIQYSFLIFRDLIYIQMTTQQCSFKRLTLFLGSPDKLPTIRCLLQPFLIYFLIADKYWLFITEDSPQFVRVLSDELKACWYRSCIRLFPLTLYYSKIYIYRHEAHTKQIYRVYENKLWL